MNTLLSPDVIRKNALLYYLNVGKNLTVIIAIRDLVKGNIGNQLNIHLKIKIFRTLGQIPKNVSQGLKYSFQKIRQKSDLQ